jgi:hypothetical protein
LSKPGAFNDCDSNTIRRLESSVGYLHERVAEFGSIEERLTSLSAIDIGYRKKGKIIIIARVAGRDVVHIVEIPPEITWKKYREITRFIQERFSVLPAYLDSPVGMPLRDFLKL